jgi:propionyl-CoA carboxylase alpha chain
MSIMPEKKQIDLASVLISPMPGIVKSVSVQVGQRVTDGQEVCVVEAMKMQNKLTAGRAGVVRTYADVSRTYMLLSDDFR